jgi:hypothetical protein
MIFYEDYFLVASAFLSAGFASLLAGCLASSFLAGAGADAAGLASSFLGAGACAKADTANKVTNKVAKVFIKIS